MSTARLARVRRLVAGLLFAVCGGMFAAAHSTSAAVAGPPALEPASRAHFVGLVTESLPAGPYTYVRVATTDAERWVVTIDPPPPPLARVAVQSHGLRHDYYSRRLDRHFTALDFGTVHVSTALKATTP